MQENKYKWNYCSLGGAVRVNITSGQDIENLDQLDQKMWTVLSCPIDGLEFDKKTLKYLDVDSDDKIRANEVIATAKWLTRVLSNKDSLLEGNSILKLGYINQKDENGARLYSSASHILRNLGLEKDEISLAEASDSVAIFKNTKFNGDGVVTASSTEDETLRDIILKAQTTIGSVADRSGEQGVTADIVEKFYAECAAYIDWISAAENDSEHILPYGADTATALATINAVKSKVEDYFLRCKLINFDSEISSALDVNPERVSSIAGDLLTDKLQELSSYPLARPTKDAVLCFSKVNPAWSSEILLLQTTLFKDKDSITEQEWNEVASSFNAYNAWNASKAGTAVESIGKDEIKKIVSEIRKQEILDIIEEDKKYESEAAAIFEVEKLLYLYRDFYKFLMNYVLLKDFYTRDAEPKAIFDAGKLFIDSRCCNLCVKVSDMGQHSNMSTLSGMFLIYCDCVSKKKNATMKIVAAMTAGGVKHLRPGKHAIFYDRSGEDWDATITSIVDNPISLRQAFWSPYVKFWDFCVGLLNKSAAEKDSKVMADLQAKAASTEIPKEGEPKKVPFDIAKFAGIFAAIGLALGYIGAAITSLVTGIKGTPVWQTLLIILAIMLVISGPSCFLAWGKLRKRNLGPILNANGWAINAEVLINILFGATLTTTPKYPKLRLKDPFAKKQTPLWKKIVRWIVLIAIAAFAYLYFTDNLNLIGINCSKEEPTEVVETPCETPVSPCEAQPLQAETQVPVVQ
ncbi:MAG: hypothetical protein KBS95_02700 [Alistipes sp.]|nr:hypothetical protein [Candidatus Alistipes equi]